MRRRTNGCWLVVLIAVMLMALPRASQAGGLYIGEFGTPSMGTAGAGANAGASDASTSFHNPAGMTRIRGKELMVTGGLIYSTVKFDPDFDTPIPGGNGGDAGGPAPLGGAFYVHSISERLKLGANVISITGAMLDYNNNWTGRYLNTDVTLLTVTFFPTIADRITDWLSVGGGPQVMYAGLELKGCYLLVRDLLKGTFDQVLARLSHVVTQPAAKIVHGAQVKATFAHVLITNGITDLEIEEEGIKHLSVAPVKTGLERFQGKQYVDRYIGARRLVGEQHREGLLVDTVEELAAENASPGRFQAVARFLRQVAQITEKRRL